jgi:cytochrome c oxidase assembly protein subunit 15
MTTAVQTPEARLAPATPAVRLWVLSLCALVFAMVVIGGITRLTRSGLSIVEWQPVSGVVPPLTEAAWEDAFRAYQRFPEYQQVNHAMTLAEFKGIFFWEYLHRLVGRLAGLVLAVPLLVLIVRRQLTRPLVRRLVFALALGGVKGLVGWSMVKSGLVNVPRVSHLRLATHLSLAFFMFSFLFWTFLDLRARPGVAGSVPPVVRRSILFVTGLVAVQIVYGAFVAGLHAGYGFNTFPRMNDGWLPDDAFDTLRDAVEHPGAVQFIHRTIAWTLVATILVLWRRARRYDVPPRVRRATTMLLGAVAVQFALGVATLLLVVPVPLAALHQVGAFALLATAVYATHSSTRSAASTP